MPARATLERLRRLLAAGGDPPAAFRALHAFLSDPLPDCSLALLLVRGRPAGTCALAALVGPRGREHLPAEDPLGLTVRLPSLDDELVRTLVSYGVPHVLQLDATLSALPSARSLLNPASLLALPMLTAQGIDHWLAIGSSQRGRFATADLDALLRDATLAYSALARPLAERALEDDAARHHRAIEGLADIQRLLQPEGKPVRGLDHAVHWQPADTAAGDYYDLMTLNHMLSDFDDRGVDAWGVMLGDVSGHGAAAAMEAVQFDAILRTYDGSEPPGGPGGAITYANRHFFSRRQRAHFMTLFSVAHRPDQGVIGYVCAGHQPAILRRGSAITLLGRDQDADIPLGVLREHRWENVLVPFGPGDLLVLYTDGITEARDPAGNMFGAERLHALVAEGEASASATLARIREALVAHQQSEIGVDDQTLIVLRQMF